MDFWRKYTFLYLNLRPRTCISFKDGIQAGTRILFTSPDNKPKIRVFIISRKLVAPLMVYFLKEILTRLSYDIMMQTRFGIPI